MIKIYHDSKNQTGETYPRGLSAEETFVVPDKLLGNVKFVSSECYSFKVFKKREQKIRD